MKWSDVNSVTVSGNTAQTQFLVNSLWNPGPSSFNATGYAEMTAFYTYNTVISCRVTLDMTNTHTGPIYCTWLFSPVQHTFTANEIIEAQNQPHSYSWNLGLPASGKSTRKVVRSMSVSNLMGENLDLTANFQAAYLGAPGRVAYGYLLVYAPVANPTYDLRTSIVFKCKWDRPVFNIG
jgi:hypothetical protein